MFKEVQALLLSGIIALNITAPVSIYADDGAVFEETTVISNEMLNSGTIENAEDKENTSEQLSIEELFDVYEEEVFPSEEEKSFEVQEETEEDVLSEEIKMLSQSEDVESADGDGMSEFNSALLGASFDGGTGVDGDPYLVSTKEQLDAIRNDLTSYYKLTADIVFSGEDFAEGGEFYNGGTGWQPIGSGWNNAFSGNFDGNGHTISGLYVNSISSYAGLFGYIEGASVSDLGMIDSNIIAVNDEFAYAGGVVGYANSNVQISGCYYSGSVSANGTYNTIVGGILGGVSELDRLSSTVSIFKCHNTGTISSNGSDGTAGGIAGMSGAIYNCYNTGSVSGGLTAGGITGFGTAYMCYNTGFISANGYGARSTQGGGIVGFGGAHECYNTGSVYVCSNGSVHPKVLAGGISGDIGSSGTVKECFNTGPVEACITSDAQYGHARAGGITGNVSSAEYISETGQILDCYNIGSISARASLEEFAGGIAGENTGLISNCYYLDTIENGVGNGTDTAVKCTNEQLRQQAAYVGFDFISFWTMDGNQDYPYAELQSVPMVYKKQGVFATVTASIESWNSTDNAKYLIYDGSLSDSDIEADLLLEEPAKALSYQVGKGSIAKAEDGKHYSQEISFVGVTPGAYKLAVYKPGKYVPLIVPFMVEAEDVELGENQLWLYGDVNNDGKVRANDATLALRSSANTEQLTPEQTKAADVNRDGKVRSNDSTNILRYSAGNSSILDEIA